MRKLYRVLLALLVFVPFLGLSSVSQVNAAGSCSNVSYSPSTPTANGFTFQTTVDPALTANSNNKFQLAFNIPGTILWHEQGDMTINGNSLSGKIDPGGTNKMDIMVRFVDANGKPQDLCEVDGVNISPATANNPLSAHCSSNFVTVPAGTQIGTPTNLTFDVDHGMHDFNVGHYSVKLNGNYICQAVIGDIGSNTCNSISTTFLSATNQLTVVGDGTDIGTVYCSLSIGPTGVVVGTPPPSIDKYDLCQQIPHTGDVLKTNPAAQHEYDSCVKCQGNPDNGQQKGIWTAVGCIKTDPKSIVQTVMEIGLSLAGGIALLMILASGFLFSTSQGDPKRTGEAKDLLTAAVIGLLFVIFSVTILQFIGVTLLQIPNFGTP